MPEAAAELVEARQWYEDREPGLGEEFVRAVRAALAPATRVPESYPVVYEEARRAPVRRFPYGVIYGVRGPVLVVFAIYHSRREPTR